MKWTNRLAARLSKLSATSGLVAGFVLAAAFALNTGAARAATIDIDPMTLSAVGALGNNDWVPTVVDDDNLAKKLTWLQPASWAEFPFSVLSGEGGVYTFTAKYGTPNPVAGDTGLPVAVTVDVRRVDTEEHIGSQDIVLTPTGDNDFAYQPTATFSAAGFNLPEGDYILRLRNVSMLHTTTGNRSAGYQWRSELGAAALRRVDIGSMQFTSTGPLPATGTITGQIGSSDLTSAVVGAYVMAVPAGQEVAEPGPFWTSGHWTISGAYGNYTLTVPAGTYTVIAGRPDCYEVAGARLADVAVPAGGTAPVNLELKSRWTATDGSGSLKVEEEYFFAKTPDALPDVTWNSTLTAGTNINLNADGNASNQFKLSWTGSGDYVDVYVDVPTGQGGQYDLTCQYNSFPGGTVQFIANQGEVDESTIQADLPNSSNDPNNPNNGYWMSATVKYTEPITLRAGRNIVREYIVSGGVDFDAFILEKHSSSALTPDVADPRFADFTWCIGEKEPGGQVAYPEKAGNTVTNLYRGNYVEIPMVFSAAGIFDATVKTQAWGPAPYIQLDLRPKDTDKHYATGDIAVPAVNSTMSTTNVVGIPVLQAGDYILRVRNTTQFHTSQATRADFNAYGPNGFIPNRMDFGQIVFTKAGALPPVGAIAGTVKASDLGNFGVAQAVVMANGEGLGVPEPGFFWYQGFWTTTDNSGAYSLPVLAGAYDVQAGQTAMYTYPGGHTPVAVSAGGTAAADIVLPSRYTQDAAGHYEVMVECEYFTAKPKDTWGGGYAASIIAFQQNGSAQNGIQMGYTDGGDFIDIPVDVPAGAGGDYTLTDYYFNGYWDGVSRPDGLVSFTANPGTGDENAIEDTQPNTAPAGSDPSAGYNVPGTKVFANPIRLLAGHNVVRMKLVSGSSNFDAFKLTSVSTFTLRASAAKALKIVGGLEAAPSPGATFTGLDPDSDGRITVRDAVKLARLGLL